MPLTRNGATQAKGKPAEPAKAKARRDARKAAVERERGLEKLVDAANLKRDPLQDLPALREFRRNGLDAELEWRRGPDLSDAARELQGVGPETVLGAVSPGAAEAQRPATPLRGWRPSS